MITLPAIVFGVEGCSTGTITCCWTWAWQRQKSTPRWSYSSSSASFLMCWCSGSLLPLFTSPCPCITMSLCWSVVGMPPSWTVPCPQGPSVPSPSRLPGTPSCKYMTKLIKLHSSIKSKQYRTIWYLSNNCIRIVSDYLSYKFYDQVCPAKDITESKLAKKLMFSTQSIVLADGRA